VSRRGSPDVLPGTLVFEENSAEAHLALLIPRLRAIAPRTIGLVRKARTSTAWNARTSDAKKLAEVWALFGGAQYWVEIGRAIAAATGSTASRTLPTRLATRVGTGLSMPTSRFSNVPACSCVPRGRRASGVSTSLARRACTARCARRWVLGRRSRGPGASPLPPSSGSRERGPGIRPHSRLKISRARLDAPAGSRCCHVGDPDLAARSRRGASAARRRTKPPSTSGSAFPALPCVYTDRQVATPRDASTV
jgi:hypothetical protein